MLEWATFSPLIQILRLFLYVLFPWTVRVFLTKLINPADNIWTNLTSAKLYNPKFNITLIVLLWGSNPALLILLPSAARRISTYDLDLWAAVALSCGLQARPACCSVISALSEHGKKKKWEQRDPQRRDQSITGSYHSVGTYSQLQGIMGNWDILLFLLQSSLYLSVFLTLLPYSYFLFVSHSSHLPSFLPFHFLLFLTVLLVSHPSLTPYLNYFPLPLLSVFLSSLHLSLSPPHPHRHPSLPILIALPTGGHSQSGLTAGCIVSTSFIVRSVYKKRTDQ